MVRSHWSERQYSHFNGFQFSARAKEAEYRLAAAQQQVRDLRDRIARDVHVTWLQAQSSFQRVGVTAQLLQQATGAQSA